jgi:ATP-dependent Lon protease
MPPKRNYTPRKKTKDDDEQPKKRQNVRKPKSRKPPKLNVNDDEKNNIPMIFPFLLSAIHTASSIDDDDVKGPKNKHKSLKDRIIKSNLDEKVKTMCLDRLKHSDSDKQKQLEWFNSLLNIPFKKYAELPINTSNTEDEIQNYFEEANNKLNDAIYGNDKVKEEIINYVAQFISTNNSCAPRIIGLSGSAGVGKTAIIKRGLSEVLKRPMKFISMGGIRDSSHFLGFEYTYSGSRYGAIVQSLIECGVMNPIIFMDELDKISNTTDGIDIQNLLIHLTDPVQNMKFQDKYFSGIDIDLSKVVFVFSFNDVNLISPILKDRIHIIKVPDPDDKSKVIIGQKYLIKEISPNIGIKEGDIEFSDEVMRFIIQDYCSNDKGVRGLKRCIETIMLKINTARFLGKLQKYKCLKNMKFPIKISKEMVEELIKKERDPRDDLIRSMFT